MCVNVTSQPEATDVLERMGAQVRFWLKWESRGDNEKQLEVVTFIFPVSEKTSTSSFHPPLLIPSQCFTHSLTQDSTYKMRFPSACSAQTARREIGQRSMEMWLNTSPAKLAVSACWDHCFVNLTKISVFLGQKNVQLNDNRVFSFVMQGRTKDFQNCNNKKLPKVFK